MFIRTTHSKFLCYFLSVCYFGKNCIFNFTYRSLWPYSTSVNSIAFSELSLKKKNTVEAHHYAHWGFIVSTNHSSPAGKNRRSGPRRAAPGSRAWWPAGSHTFTLSPSLLLDRQREDQGKYKTKNLLGYKLHWTKQTANVHKHHCI